MNVNELHQVQDIMEILDDLLESKRLIYPQQQCLTEAWIHLRDALKADGVDYYEEEE